MWRICVLSHKQWVSWMEFRVSAPVCSLYSAVSPLNRLHIDFRRHERDVLTDCECSPARFGLRGKGLQLHLTSYSSPCWKKMNPLLYRLLSISSNYPSARYHSLFLCGRAAAHASLLVPFGELIHFLLKCLNNYSDIEVNCLISIAMEASGWNPHTICSRNSSQKILSYQRGRSDLNKVLFFFFFFSFFGNIQQVADRELRYTVECH